MLHDLIKAANRNLAPGADPEKDWLKYADETPSPLLRTYTRAEEDEEDEEEWVDDCVTEEEMEDAEEIEWEEGDEYEEAVPCECEDDEFHLTTTVDELDYYSSLETFQDSEILEDFITEVVLKLDYDVRSSVFKSLIKENIDLLPFLTIEVFKDDSILITVKREGLIDYLETN